MESSTPAVSDQRAALSDPRAALIDLGFFLAAMFLIRTVTVPGLGFVGNGLMYSVVTLGVATWRLRVRGESWRSLGLRRPESFVKMAAAVVLILVLVVASVVIFEPVLESWFPPTEAAPSAASTDPAIESTDTRFAGIEGNIAALLSILFFVWIESFFEELQDRCFSLTRFEGLFSRIPFPVPAILAVVSQAAIFGFRHSPSHGVSGAFIVVLIGLIMGLAYVAFGRNLWAPIVAHGVLNSLSMIERFFG